MQKYTQKIVCHLCDKSSDRITPSKENTPQRAEHKKKEIKKMMSKIKSNPALAAALCFILTWAAFPVAGLIASHLKGITFAAAVCTPYMIGSFSVCSIIAAVQMYNKMKNRLYSGDNNSAR